MEEADGSAGGSAAGGAAISAAAKKASSGASREEIKGLAKKLYKVLSDPDDYKPGTEVGTNINNILFAAVKELDGIPELDKKTKDQAKRDMNLKTAEGTEGQSIVNILKTFVDGLKSSNAPKTAEALAFYIEMLEDNLGTKKKKSKGWSSQPPEMKQKWQELVKIDKDIASKFGSKGSYREWQRWYMTSTKDKEAWEALGKPKRKYLSKKETLDLLDILIKSNKGTLEERLMRKWFNIL